MHRFKLLLLMTFVVAVTVIFWKIDVTNAEPASSSATREVPVQNRASSAAHRAREKRKEFLKKRQEAQKQIKKIIEGQQPQSATGSGIPAPDKEDKGVQK